MPNTPTLPAPFPFNQSNLQDYRTCARRFALRYLRHLNWPAVETGPIQEAERRMQLGSDFHRLVHQHVLGMPLERLQALAEENPYLPELADMWRAYLAHRPPLLSDPAARLYPEITLSTMIKGHRLTAKIDLLVIHPEQILIIDWKTAPRRAAASILHKRVQSRVYPYIFTTTGASLNQGQPIDPAKLTMWYWFTSQPNQPEIIPYSQTQFNADQVFLRALITEIEAEREFPLTEDQKACRFCVYRSYCDRGRTAAAFEELDEDLHWDDEDLDWEQVSEITY